MRSVIATRSLFAWVILFTIPAAAQGPIPAPANLTAPATADTGMVVGDFYRIQIDRRGVKTQVSGNLLKVTDRWLLLHSMRVHGELAVTPYVGDIPLIGRAFWRKKNTRVDEHIWVPRDALTMIEEHVPPKQPQPLQPFPGDAPPIKTACAVEVVTGNKLVRREGGTEAISLAGITLAVPKTVSVQYPAPAFGLLTLPGGVSTTNKSETRYTREHFAQQDIVCVRVANFLAPLPEQQPR